MSPLITTLLGAGVKVLAARATPENLKDKTTIAAAVSASAAVGVGEAFPAESPEALIIQAVLSVLTVVLFFWPPKKKCSA